MTHAADPNSPPPFEAVLPDNPSTPVVVSVPHAGLAVGGFESALSPALDVRCDGDLFVDELYRPGVRGAFVVARLSRFVCDLNRHPDDVSARAVPTHPGPLNSDGRGFIWEVTTAGEPAQARPLTYREWEARRAYHAAYYAVLARALETARKRFGFAILVDGHSMPSVGRKGHNDTGRERAAFVPGDRDGTSCGPRLMAVVSEHFAHAGYRVAPNDPYKGGFITRHHGRPADQIHAIQIEMRRDLYMSESQYLPIPHRMTRAQDLFAGLLDRLGKLDPRT